MDTLNGIVHHFKRIVATPTENGVKEELECLGEDTVPLEALLINTLPFTPESKNTANGSRIGPWIVLKKCLDAPRGQGAAVVGGSVESADNIRPTAHAGRRQPPPSNHSAGRTHPQRPHPHQPHPHQPHSHPNQHSKPGNHLIQAKTKLSTHMNSNKQSPPFTQSSRPLQSSTYTNKSKKSQELDTSIPLFQDE